MPAYDPQNIFARILRGEIPNDTVLETLHTLAFRDIRPQAPVHVLVIPKGAYVSYDDFATNASDAEIVDFNRAIARLTRAVHELEMGKQQQLVDALSQEFSAVEEGIAKLTAEIELLEAKLEDARGRQKAMLLRSAAAQSRLNVQQHGQRATPHSIMEKFDRMERKIEEMESKADVYNPNPNLQQQFAELEVDDAISRELAAMKADGLIDFNRNTFRLLKKS